MFKFTLEISIMYGNTLEYKVYIFIGFTLKLLYYNVSNTLY